MCVRVHLFTDAFTVHDTLCQVTYDVRAINTVAFSR